MGQLGSISERSRLKWKILGQSGRSQGTKVDGYVRNSAVKRAGNRLSAKLWPINPLSRTVLFSSKDRPLSSWPCIWLERLSAFAQGRLLLRDRSLTQWKVSARMKMTLMLTDHQEISSRNWVSFGVILDTIYDRKLRFTVNYNCRPHIKLSLQNVPILRLSFIQVNLCSS